MSFYQTLQQATASEREHLFNAPIIEACRRGDISRDTYLAFLAQAYYHVRQTIPLLMATGGKLGQEYEWVRGAIAAFTSAGSDPFEQHLVIALTFFIVSFPCVGLWLLCGSLLKRWLANDLARRRFNQVMAALLVLSVVPVIREILIPA